MSESCFSSPDLISVERAIEHLLEKASSTPEKEILSLKSAAGRILAGLRLRTGGGEHRYPLVRTARIGSDSANGAGSRTWPRVFKSHSHGRACPPKKRRLKQR